jgi:hypothetical protein
VVSETRLEESVLQPAPQDVPASDTIVESAEKVDERMMSELGTTERRWHSVHLILALAAVERARVVDDEKDALCKQKRMSMTNTMRQWQEV